MMLISLELFNNSIILIYISLNWLSYILFKMNNIIENLYDKYFNIKKYKPESKGVQMNDLLYID